MDPQQAAMIQALQGKPGTGLDPAGQAMQQQMGMAQPPHPGAMMQQQGGIAQDASMGNGMPPMGPGAMGALMAGPPTVPPPAPIY